MTNTLIVCCMLSNFLFVYMLYTYNKNLYVYNVQTKEKLVNDNIRLELAYINQQVELLKLKGK